VGHFLIVESDENGVTRPECRGIANALGGAIGCDLALERPERHNGVMRAARFFASALLAAILACSSSVDEFDDPDVAAHPANPQGVAYPTDNIGWTARANAKLPGKRIPNLAFQGYVDSNRSAGLKVISLSDFYDPKAEKYKAIHVQVAATWCPNCKAQAADTAAKRDALVARGAALLEVIVAGNTHGAGPSIGEVDSWITDHKTNFTVLIDVRAKRLGPIANGGSEFPVPLNMLIDPRTMEILRIDSGYPDDANKYVGAAIDFVNGTPPSY